MSDNRMRIWFSLFVLAVFCVGMATGVLIGRNMLSDRPFARGGPRGGPMDLGPAGGRGPGPGGRPPREMILERLTDALELTADQQAKVETVLKASRARIDDVQRDVRGRFEAEQQQLRHEIRQVLRPDQYERFEKWHDEQSRGRGRRGPPPPPR